MKGYQIFFIAIPILDLLLDYIEGKYILKISEEEKISEALIYRKRYAKNRSLFFRIIIFMAFILMIVIDGFNEAARTSPILVGWIYSKRKRLSKHCNQVSCSTLHDINNNDFILYLRGFSSDSYEDGISLEKNSDIFSESKIIKVLNLYYPVYAVGMPKELYAPYGAKRIYLEDGSWESDVMNLIKRAKMVLVYLNDTESCIKEIHHCSYYSDKTLYIVDNIYKFQAVKDYCRKNNLRNTLPLFISQNGTYACFSNYGNKIKIRINNTPKCYRSIINYFTSNVLGWNRCIFGFTKTYTNVLICSIILFPILSIIFNIPKTTNYIFYTLWFIFAAIMFFHQIPYQYTKDIWKYIPRELFATHMSEKGLYGID